MILLFTDFGGSGPYMGEMRTVLLRQAPGVPVVDLMIDAAAFRPDLAAYHLAALWPTAEPGDVMVAIVDPGVGGPRSPLAVEVDGRWLVGPDNGLLELVLRRAGAVRGHAIAWRPPRLSASFHGRDLFAPIAARLARGDRAGLVAQSPTRHRHWPDDLPAIIHIDGYGNLVTGLRAAMLPPDAVLEVAGQQLARRRTFADTAPGMAFWYENSSGLAELAVSSGRAAERLRSTIGDPVRLVG